MHTPKPEPRLPAGDQQQIEAVLARGISLPAPDAHLLTLMRIAADDDSGLDEIAGVVALDPAITGAVFRVAASPVFGQIRPRRTILEAVVLLGKTKVLAIATSTALRLKVSDIDPRALEAIWSASHTIATHAWAAARRSKRRQLADLAFLAGLLHEVGIALILRQYPQYAQLCLGSVAAVNALGPRLDAMLGIGHAAIGAMIARDWRLPPEVADAIAIHHTPPETADETDTPVLLAGLLAAGRQLAGVMSAAELLRWSPLLGQQLALDPDTLRPDPDAPA